MKTLKDYIAESAEWMTTPAEGDDFAIELDDETLIETYIIEVADDCILLDSTPEINAALSEWAALEDTDEGDSGVIMETMGYGSLVGEEDDAYSRLRKDAEAMAIKQMTAPKPVAPKPGFMAQVGDKIIGGVKGAAKGFAGGTAAVEEGSMKREMHAAAETMSLEDFRELYGYEDWIEEFWRVSNGVDKDIDEDQDAAVVAGKEAAIAASQQTYEAEYRGRKVALGKPMAGDVKKFKVYVRDPATGNVKKVNFGHGGKSAKRAGQKTMRIRKSNPKARKSFRARHNCANPGPRTKARYWSCRKW